MKYKILIITLCFLIISCTKADEISGIIVQEINLSECLNKVLDNETETEFIIKNDSIFNQLIEKHTDEIELLCINNDIPSIDFKKYSLLGKFTEADGKIRYYERSVTEDRVNKKYIYSIIIHAKGFRKILAIDYNWVLVPKIPDNYTVEFKVIAK